MTGRDEIAAPGAASMYAILCGLLAFGALAPEHHLEAQANSGSFTVHGASLCDQRDVVESELLSDGFEPTSGDPDESASFRGTVAKQPVTLGVTFGADGRATRYRTTFPEDVPSPEALFTGIRSGLAANYGEPDREAGASESAEGATLVWRRDAAIGPTLLELRHHGGTISIVVRPEDPEALDCEGGSGTGDEGAGSGLTG